MTTFQSHTDRKGEITMTENEAKLILDVRISRFDHAGDVNEALEIAKQALEEIQQYREIGTVEECQEAVEKQKVKYIKIESYCSAYCPTCRFELSESLGDGYYEYFKNLSRCPKCGQKICWYEDLEEMEDE